MECELYETYSSLEPLSTGCKSVFLRMVYMSVESILKV